MTKLSVLYKKFLITILVLGAILTPNLAYSKGIDKSTADAYKQENAAEQQELDYIEESTYDINTAYINDIEILKEKGADIVFSGELAVSQILSNYIFNEFGLLCNELECNCNNKNNKDNL